MNVSVITGSTGIYTGKIQNPSIRYGMNAANNLDHFARRQSASFAQEEQFEYEVNLSNDFDIFANALEKFATALEVDTYTPSTFRYEYANPNQGEYDKLSLLGAAYEEMGRKNSISVRKMNKKLNSDAVDNKNKFDSRVLDTNNNKRIEVEEYATFLALCDMKSKETGGWNDIESIDGTITEKGIEEAKDYLRVKPADKKTTKNYIEFIKQTFGGIQADLNLTEAKEKFDQEIKHIRYMA